MPPDRPRMIPRQGSDPAAERLARWARMSVTELLKEAADLRRTWPACPHLGALEAAIGTAQAASRSRD